jgi:hypothetical protein
MKVKNLALGVGIVILFALMLWQGIEAFSPSPQWDDYCGKVIPRTAPDKLEINQSYCLETGGNWTNGGYGYCDYYSECQKEFDDASKAYSQVVFIVAAIAGIIALITGYFVLSVEPVGSALIGSGIWAFFYGSVVNWRNFSNIWRFLLLALAFVLLVWLTLRFNRTKKKK